MNFNEAAKAFPIDDENLKHFLEGECGYEEVRYIEGVGWCGLQRMCFTWGVMLAMDEIGPRQGRFCFMDRCEASHFLKHWDGMVEPIAGKNGCTANKRSIPK